MDEVSGITFENVWGNKSPELRNEIIQTWARLKVLPPDEDPLKRVKQVVFIIRDLNKEVIGISTAINIKIPTLGNHLFNFRALIDPDYRIPGLFINLSSHTFNFLESIHDQLSPKPIGLIAEIESPLLQKLRSVKTATGFMFIGFAKNGNPVRVKYFKGAEF